MENIHNMSLEELSFQFLRWKMWQGWQKKSIPTTEEYLARARYELKVVRDMKFTDYFLIIEDLISWAKGKGIPVGPGRGSGAGSIICYALDITTLDPIYFGLLFERFLNPSRISMPDLDLDFCRERRHEVVEYATQRYGVDHVAHIIAFGTMGPKAAIKDVSRALRFDDYLMVSDRLSKAISVKAETLDAAIKDSDFLKQAEATYPDLFRLAKAISGKTRQTSIHPAGVIITPKPIAESLPLFFGAKNKESGTMVTQWDMYDIEETGFLKIDFLGLNTLTIIDKTIKKVNAVRKAQGLPTMTAEDIALDDPVTLDWFSRGVTTGIFQLERKYVQDFCRRMGIKTFLDVVAMNAIIRPGTMDAGQTDHFINRRNGDEEAVPLHKDIAHLLTETEQIIVYQEQAMQIAQVFAGFSLAEADNLRKAIGKKIASKMAVMKELFLKKAVEEMGHTKEESELVFSNIETAARYSFNKSHAAAYGKITFQAEWLKSHYTTEFMCELLNGEYGGSGDSSVGQYVEEARYLGIEIIPPSIKTSGAFFEIRGPKKIEFGLAFVRNVSFAAVNEIMKARKIGFKSFAEFLASTDFKALNSKAMASLINTGAFDSFGTCRDELLERHMKMRLLINKHKQQQKRKEDGVKLRSELVFQSIVELEREPVEVFEKRNSEKKLDVEFHETGAYLTDSPMAPFEHEIREHTNTDIADILDGFCHRKNVCIAGMITEKKEHVIKKGKYQGQEMAFLTVSKDQRFTDCLVFSEMYVKLKDMLNTGKVYLLYGTIKDGSVIVSDAKLLSGL